MGWGVRSIEVGIHEEGSRGSWGIGSRHRPKPIGGPGGQGVELARAPQTSIARSGCKGSPSGTAATKAWPRLWGQNGSAGCEGPVIAQCSEWTMTVVMKVGRWVETGRGGDVSLCDGILHVDSDVVAFALSWSGCDALPAKRGKGSVGRWRGGPRGGGGGHSERSGTSM
jgi:hypothetical protein